MPKTKISDVIVPSVFNPYVIQRTMELSALFQCGIVANNPELDKLASSGGATINMPYWEDLDGEDEVLSDSTALTPEKIKAGQDIAVLLMRGKSWSSNDLAATLSGADPMAAVGDLVAGYKARRMQAALISILTGAFAGTGMKNKVYDATCNSADGRAINGETFLDALQLMGDAKGLLTGVAMHSSTETRLRKNNLIQTELDSNNEPIAIFMGKRVIIDDDCPRVATYKVTTDSTPTTGKTYYTKSGNVYTAVESPASNPATAGYYEFDKWKYTTYLFGAGAIGYGNGKPEVPTETDRDSLASDDILIHRWHNILHPRGVKWIGTPAGASPTNAELANGSNWYKVYEDKAIRMVKFDHYL